METNNGSIKLTRIAPGFYTTTIDGIVYEITNAGGDVSSAPIWYWNRAGERADDVYSTRREAVAALVGFVRDAKPAAPAISEMERVARIFDGMRAGLRTVSL